MYEFNISLNQPFDTAKEQVIAALAEQQLGIVSEINVQAVMKKKLNQDVPPYTILGACNPKLAHQVIDIDANAGALLPCNVVVRATDDNTTVISFMNPQAILSLVNNDAVSPIADDAHARLTRVAAALTA